MVTISNCDEKYAVEANRLMSFSDWPKALEQTPSELSKAGFYYTGRGDMVICFSCGGGLKDWIPGDVPWEQHGMFFQNCQYVNLVKGEEFVKHMREKLQSEENRSEENRSLPTTLEEKIESNNDLCSICVGNRCDIAFIPCGHVCVCKECVFGLKKCPICRIETLEILKLFFS